MINPWLKNLAQNMARTSGFFDEKELPWIAEIKEKSRSSRRPRRRPDFARPTCNSPWRWRTSSTSPPRP
eukprot:1059713-Alexandrium_andersonii.AAC.1